MGDLRSKIAFLFPGQGSQHPGMGKELFDNYAAAREVYAEADEALGFSLSRMCFEGSEADLQLTANTQPAILATSIAALRALESEADLTAGVAAGHSLGEYSALVAAGTMQLADALRIVRSRGTYMQEAVPVGVGAMAAVMGLDLDSVEAACQEAAEGQICSAANINSRSQVVIAGNAEAVDRACEIVKAKGAKRAIKLNVSAPFHCELMRPAADRLTPDLAEIAFGEFAYPIVNNVAAEVTSDPAAVADDLIRQIWSPVRWLQSVERLTAEGIDTIVEIGPGKVLSGLVRQINGEIRGFNISDTQSLKTTLETL